MKSYEIERKKIVVRLKLLRT